MKYYSVRVYFRCVEDECVYFLIENFYDLENDFKAIGVSDYFFDENSSDILWHSTQSYDNALNKYLQKLPSDSEREKNEEGLEEKWPICETLYLEYEGDGSLNDLIFIKFFEESFIEPVPIVFPDMDTFSEVAEEDFRERDERNR